ncbi:MAG: hypothetical protein ACOVT5_00680 [Armatimonadaceae bacterium]|jgi:hypothetical protein
MPYNRVYRKTDVATATCQVGTGAPVSAVASSQSIISQRDADRKAAGYAKGKAQAGLVCTR